MDIIVDLVKNIVRTNYHDLPTKAIDYTKMAVLDTLGTTIGGSAREGCKPVVDQVKEWGGREEATIMIYGGKVPSPLAALANGTMARALDFDDVHEGAACHPSAYLVPTSFAIAQRNGGLSGRDFITAISLGADLMCRMGLANKVGPIESGHHNIYRIFGPTTAASKILGLDEDKMINAMGIAYTLATGDLQCFNDGALTVRVQQGLVSQAAITSALLAQRGITGARNVLQGRYGYYTVYEPKHALEELTSDLGQRFEGANSSIKPYPSCKCTHTSINATLDLVREHDIHPQNVEEVLVGMNKVCHDFICEPPEIKRRPRNIVDGQFSVPYTVAAAVVRKDVFIDSFTEEAVKDRKVLEMIGKIKTFTDPEIDRLFAGQTIGPAVVTIKTKGGKEYFRRVDYAIGHPKNPITMNDVIEKFRKGLPFSANPLSEEKVKRIVEMICHLEEIPNVAEIPELLTP